MWLEVLWWWIKTSEWYHRYYFERGGRLLGEECSVEVLWLVSIAVKHISCAQGSTSWVCAGNIEQCWWVQCWVGYIFFNMEQYKSWEQGFEEVSFFFFFLSSLPCFTPSGSLWIYCLLSPIGELQTCAAAECNASGNCGLVAVMVLWFLFHQATTTDVVLVQFSISQSCIHCVV